MVNIWNSLPNVVVLASSLDTFKNRLDRFWVAKISAVSRSGVKLHTQLSCGLDSGGIQDVKYDYTAELTGAGSRSEFYMK